MGCPICKLSDAKEVTKGTDLYTIECRRCGQFKISGSAKATASNRDADFQLSAWIRNQQDGSDLPSISSQNIDEIGKGLPQYRVSEKQILFLRALERMTTYAGDLVAIAPENDFPLGWCKTAQELLYIIHALKERGFVKSGTQISSLHQLTITPSGWTFLDETNKPSILSNQAFVAMSFDPDLRSAWENGIELAVANAGFQPYRVDASPHIDRIDMKIISQIKNSRFLIADVTQQRPGVYFEAGYAIGLGLPVFWSVRKSDLDKVHFDTRQYNHIVWENETQLAEKLYDFITAIVGKGSAAH